MKNKNIIEYSVITKKDELHTENKDEAQTFYNSLSNGQKKSAQYFSKEWIRQGNSFVEGEVIILK